MSSDLGPKQNAPGDQAPRADYEGAPHGPWSLWDLFPSEQKDQLRRELIEAARLRREAESRADEVRW